MSFKNVILSFKESQEVLSLDENQFLLVGNSPQAHFQVPFGPAVSFILQVHDEKLSVTLCNPDWKVNFQGVDFPSLILNGSAFFDVNGINVVVEADELHQAVEQTQYQAPMAPLEPVTIKKSDNSSEQLVIKQGNAANLKEVLFSPEELEKMEDEAFNFDIKFQETTVDNIHTLFDHEYTFNSYIDTIDETVEVPPSPEITKEVAGQSILVTYTHNGVLLHEKYIPVAEKNAYLSSMHNAPHFFKIPNFPSSQTLLTETKGESVLVHPVEGYELKYCDKENKQVQAPEDNHLNSEVRAVYSQGLNQISVELSNIPPRVKTETILDMDERMVKSLAISWAFSIIVLVMTLAFQEDKKEIEEIPLVIYKRAEVEVIQEKKLVNVEDTMAGANTQVQEVAPEPKVAENLTEVNKKLEAPKVAKKTKEAAKLKSPKKRKALAKSPKSQKVRAQSKKATEKRVVKKADQKVEAPKKKMKFDFGAKLSSVSTPATVKVDSTAGNNTMDVTQAFKAGLDTGLKGQVSVNSDDRKVGKLKASRSIASINENGVAGLSDKSDTLTTYSVAKTKVLGAVDPSLIRKIMREYIPQFRHCYQRELFKNNSLEGAFDLNFQINGSGKGMNVSIKKDGPSFSQKGVNCIRKVVSMIDFPKPKGGGTVDVRQPMNFQSKK